jgi:two-component system phosphate regulon sensor histidine kinase PhoR
MQKKLMSSYIVVILITIAVVALFSWNRGNKYFEDTIKKDSVVQVVLLNEILELEDKNGKIDFEDFVSKYSKLSNYRITVIDRDGVVVGDSDEDYRIMENHSYREEITKALNGETASSVRFSNTLDSYYLYTAKPLELDFFDGVLRISMPLLQVKQVAVEVIKYILFSIVLGALAAIILAYMITRKLMKPIDELTNGAIEISNGNFDRRIFIRSKDQIGKLADSFNEMTMKMNDNLRKLEYRKSELESVLSSMKNGIIAVDNDYKVFLYNDAFRDILEIEEENFEGKQVHEVVRNSSIFKLLENSIKRKQYEVDEINTYGDKDRIIKIYASPILSNSDNEKKLGTLLIIQDITRVRKLQNIRSEFVSNVTHELRTPLTSIRGFVDTLKDGAINDEEASERFLSIIDIEAERLSQLINDILSLSEIENMREERNLCECNIKDIVNKVFEIFEPRIKDKEIELVLEIPENISNFMCNSNRIKQLLINLIDNAINYTEEGKVKVSCREDEDYMIIEVEDTGVGIDNEHLPRLFERFYRVNKGRARKDGGTGLGLAIVKHIAELYNGTVSVESEVDKGTKFTVKLVKER